MTICQKLSSFSMKRLLTCILCSTAFMMAAQSETPSTELLSRTVDLEVAHSVVPVPITLFGEASEDGAELTITAVAQLDALVNTVGKALEEEADKRDRGCRERWDGSNGVGKIDDGTISLSVTVRVEKWVCERLFGEELRTRIARETTRLHATFSPKIVNGRLHVHLVSFRAEDLSVLAQEFGVEDKLRDALLEELDAFNQDAKKSSLPSALSQIGFQYHDVRFYKNDAAIGEVTIKGPNDGLAILAAMQELAQ